MADQVGSRAEDPYGGRQPSSHERLAGRPWDASYTDGPAPWDIGEPQPAVVRLADAEVFGGAVLDAGCGTGDNALHLAARGSRPLGIDVAETAVSIAREHAAARGLEAEFLVADALRLDRLERRFDTVLDCALFHALDDEERLRYVASLASATRPGATLYLLCFSDVDPESNGPHPVSHEELAAPFTPASGWTIASIGSERLLARFAPDGVPAWLAKVERV
jgi:2-polyprenyl-3-methyl-5-hydroxy-6-metoxy-1,4-benzoquinol methylase